MLHVVITALAIALADTWSAGANVSVCPETDIALGTNAASKQFAITTNKCDVLANGTGSSWCDTTLTANNYLYCNSSGNFFGAQTSDGTQWTTCTPVQEACNNLNIEYCCSRGNYTSAS